MDAGTGLTERVGRLLEERSGWFLLSMVAATLLPAVPMAIMAPGHTAADNPGGRLYDPQDLVDANLPPRIHDAFFVAEAVGGDILTQAPLWELYLNTQALKETDRNGQLNPPCLEEQQYLYNGFDTDRQQPIFGIFTVADAVQEALAQLPLLNTDLEHASDEQVKVAVHFVLNDPRTDILEDTLSNELKTSERHTVLGQGDRLLDLPRPALSRDGR